MSSSRLPHSTSPSSRLQVGNTSPSYPSAARRRVSLLSSRTPTTGAGKSGAVPSKIPGASSSAGAKVSEAVEKSVELSVDIDTQSVDTMSDVTLSPTASSVEQFEVREPVRSAAAERRIGANGRAGSTAGSSERKGLSSTADVRSSRESIGKPERHGLGVTDSVRKGIAPKKELSRPGNSSGADSSPRKSFGFDAAKRRAEARLSLPNMKEVAHAPNGVAGGHHQEDAESVSSSSSISPSRTRPGSSSHGLASAERRTLQNGIRSKISTPVTKAMLEPRTADLETELNSLKAKLADVEKNWSGAEAQLADLKEKLVAKDAVVKALTKRDDGSGPSPEERVQLLEKELEEALATGVAAKAERDAVKAAVEGLEREAKNLKRTVALATTERDAMKANLFSTAKEGERLSKVLALTSGEVEKLKDALAGAQDDHDSLRQVLADVSTERNTLLAALAEAKKQVQQLKDEAAAAGTSSAGSRVPGGSGEVQPDSQKLGEEVERLRVQYRELQKECEEMRGALTQEGGGAAYLEASAVRKAQKDADKARAVAAAAAVEFVTERQSLQLALSKEVERRQQATAAAEVARQAVDAAVEQAEKQWQEVQQLLLQGAATPWRDVERMLLGWAPSPTPVRPAGATEDHSSTGFGSSPKWISRETARSSGKSGNLGSPDSADAARMSFEDASRSPVPEEHVDSLEKTIKDLQKQLDKMSDKDLGEDQFEDMQLSHFAELAQHQQHLGLLQTSLDRMEVYAQSLRDENDRLRAAMDSASQNSHSLAAGIHAIQEDARKLHNVVLLQSESQSKILLETVGAPPVLQPVSGSATVYIRRGATK